MKPLLLTSGEPAGIGVDLCIQIAQLGLTTPFVVMADPTLLLQRAHRLGLPLEIHYYELGDEFPHLVTK
jgi:4-hydroxythreonine-4-phosphate dehydrogenase